MLTKNDLKQIKVLLKDQLDVQKTDILIETRVIVRNEIYLALKPIEKRLFIVEKKLDQLIKTESEDVKVAYIDIEKIKEEIKEIKVKLRKYEFINAKK